MNWILVMTVSVGFTKLLTDCTGSKWCETLLKRTPVTHSSGKLTGGARIKPWKTTAFYFVLESNSGRFSNEKKSGWRAKKWSPEKTFGFEHFRWWSRNDELSFRLSTTDCNAWVRPLYSSQNIIPGCVSLYFVREIDYHYSLEVKHFRIRDCFINTNIQNVR